MLRLKTASSDAQYLLSGKLMAFIPDLASAQALEAAGVALATVSDAFLHNVQAAAAPVLGIVNVDLTPITSRQDALKADLDTLTLKKV